MMKKSKNIDKVIGKFKKIWKKRENIGKFTDKNDDSDEDKKEKKKEKKEKRKENQE